MPAFLRPWENALVQALGFDGRPSVGTRARHHLRHEDHFPSPGFTLFRLNARSTQATNGKRHAIGRPDARRTVHILEGLPSADRRRRSFRWFADGRRTVRTAGK